MLAFRLAIARGFRCSMFESDHLIREIDYGTYYEYITYGYGIEPGDPIDLHVIINAHHYIVAEGLL